MNFTNIHPEGWASPKGYANGVLVEGAQKLLFIAGQVAWDADQHIVGPGDFALQFRQTLANVVAIVEASGGQASAITSLTIYVTDKQLYMDALKPIGAAYRELCGKHFPAMALVQVAALLEEGAMIEIQGIAAF